MLSLAAHRCSKCIRQVACAVPAKSRWRRRFRMRFVERPLAPFKSEKMATHPASPKRNYLPGRKRRPAILATSIVAFAALCLVPQGVRGQSTWLNNPGSSDWNDAANWRNPSDHPKWPHGHRHFRVAPMVTAVSITAGYPGVWHHFQLRRHFSLHDQASLRR